MFYTRFLINLSVLGRLEEALTYHPLIFLWNFLKKKVYHEAPTTIEELKQKTETKIKHIYRATRKVLHSLKKKTCSGVY